MLLPITAALDEAHRFYAHYVRHLWLDRDNPLGVFTPMNPNVTCEHPVRPAHAAP